MPDPLRSLLADHHISRRATLAEYHGGLVPARFSDPVAEHCAVRAAAGVFDVSFRAKVAAKGADRASFLHNMLSNDIKSLTPGHGAYAALLDLKGHIVADVRVYCAEEAFLLDTDTDLRDKLVRALERYIVMDDVALEPLELCTVSFQGPRSRALVEETLGVGLPALSEFDHFLTTGPGYAARVVCATSTGEDGFEVWVEPNDLRSLWETASRKALASGALPCGTEALESLRIEAGIPRYGPDFGEDTLPLEAGLLNALNFTKGCYLGQEIVERARSRGHVNWKLVGLFVEASAPPAPGEKLLSDGKELGEVTSSCFSPTLGKTLALAYVRREVSGPGTELTLDSGGKVRVVALPFYSRPKTGS